MFEKINENVARSNNGFEVRVRPGRWVIEYSEDDRTITVGFEFLSGDPIIAVYPSIMEVSVPSSSAASLSQDESERVIKNILLALEFLGWTYQMR